MREVLITLMFFSLFISNTPLARAQNGEVIFRQKCSACHRIGGGRFVGPDLKGVHERRAHDWLVNFIRSSQTIIKAGDTAAVNVYERFNKVPMPDQNINDAEMEALLAYIANPAGSAPPENPTAIEKIAPPPVALQPAKPKEKERHLTPEEKKARLELFFNKGAVVSLLALSILFASITLMLLRRI